MMHVAINRAFHRLGFIDITLLTSLLVQASTVYGSYLDSLGEAVSQEATSDLQHARCNVQQTCSMQECRAQGSAQSDLPCLYRSPVPGHIRGKRDEAEWTQTGSSQTWRFEGNPYHLRLET